MGITAKVTSNCYRDGKSTPCPFPDEFIIDEVRGPMLTIKYIGNEQKYKRFWDWLKECCEYPDMLRANEFIASWRDYYTFNDALKAVGVELFPILTKNLPDGNAQGITPAEESALALEEIAYFQSLPAVDQSAILVDTERGQDVSKGSNVLGGALTMDRVSGFDLGFDEQGFFVRDRWELNRELFRAYRVEQTVINPEDFYVEYRDLDNDKVFRCSAPFGQMIHGEDGLPRAYLKSFHVELRDVPPARYAYIIDPLIRVFEASVETGNAVRWS
jgi:hypothetical protein